jgi:hypothetical protein
LIVLGGISKFSTTNYCELFPSIKTIFRMNSLTVVNVYIFENASFMVSLIPFSSSSYNSSSNIDKFLNFPRVNAVMMLRTGKDKLKRELKTGVNAFVN